MKDIHIISCWKNFAVDNPTSKAENGQDIHAWTFHGGQNQSWIYKDELILSAINPEYCLDVVGSKYINGNQVNLWKKHGGINQKWIFEDGFIKCKANKNFCLDIDNSTGKNGSKIQIYKILNSPNQRWRMVTKAQLKKEEKAKKIVLLSKWKNFAVDIPESKTCNAQKVNAWTYHGRLNQNWIFKDGYIHSALNPDYCLDVFGPFYKNGTHVHLHFKHGNPSQKWVLVDDILLNEGNRNFCLDIDNSTGKNGSKIQIYEVLNWSNQKWKLLTKEQIQKEKEKKAIQEAKAQEKRRREQERAAKLAAKEEEKRRREEEKAKKLKEHSFKTSRGEMFCRYCGWDNSYSSWDCHGRENGHNYVLMKKGDKWEPTCNKCGNDKTWDQYSCG